MSDVWGYRDRRVFSSSAVGEVINDAQLFASVENPTSTIARRRSPLRIVNIRRL